MSFEENLFGRLLIARKMGERRYTQSPRISPVVKLRLLVEDVLQNQVRHNDRPRMSENTLEP
jgi:hypothetical protein